jgi:hypothetical protein
MEFSTPHCTSINYFSSLLLITTMYRRGCDCCIDCGLPCSREIQVIDANRELPEQPKAKLEQAQNKRAPSNHWGHSDREEEICLIEPLRLWFDSWPQRRQIWNRYSEEWGRKYRRIFACGKHDFADLICISGTQMPTRPPPTSRS